MSLSSRKQRNYAKLRYLCGSHYVKLLYLFGFSVLLGIYPFLFQQQQTIQTSPEPTYPFLQQQQQQQQQQTAQPFLEQESNNLFWSFDEMGLSPETHFQTVDGKTLPRSIPPQAADGPLSKNTSEPGLLVLGARITSSIQKDQTNDLFLHVFGLGFFKRQTITLYHNLKAAAKFLSSEQAQKLSVFGQLVPNTTTRNETNLFWADKPPSCSRPFRMTYIPARGSSAAFLSIKWGANITHCVNVLQVQRASSVPQNIQTETGNRIVSGFQEKSLRLHLWAIKEGPISNRKVSQLQPSFSIDIPLSTGVVGVGGPHIRSKAVPISSDATTTRVHKAALLPSFVGRPPVAVAHCLNVFGDRAKNHVLEWIQHHKNLGVEHFVVGINYVEGENHLQSMTAVLQHFIDEGTVVIADLRLPSEEFGGFGCNIYQLSFYQTCLYHSKGVAEYLSAWDLDEYWIPPSAGFPLLPANASLNKKPHSRTTPELLRRDPIWRQSPYRSLPSIADAMDAVSQYQESFGCGDDGEGVNWCQHVWQSFSVHSKCDESGKKLPGAYKYESTPLASRFEKRRSDRDARWNKPMVRTANTYAMGVHGHGSCTLRSHRKTTTYPYSPSPRRTTPYEMGTGKDKKCGDLEILGFGSLNHFLELLGPRFQKNTTVANYAQLPDEEYIKYYASTVQLQLQKISQRNAL